MYAVFASFPNQLILMNQVSEFIWPLVDHHIKRKARNVEDPLVYNIHEYLNINIKFNRYLYAVFASLPNQLI